MYDFNSATVLRTLSSFGDEAGDGDDPVGSGDDGMVVVVELVRC